MILGPEIWKWLKHAVLPAGPTYLCRQRPWQGCRHLKADWVGGSRWPSPTGGLWCCQWAGNAAGAVTGAPTYDLLHHNRSAFSDLTVQVLSEHTHHTLLVEASTHPARITEKGHRLHPLQRGKDQRIWNLFFFFSKQSQSILCYAFLKFNNTFFE